MRGRFEETALVLFRKFDEVNMNQYTLKKHKARIWLSMMAVFDVLMLLVAIIVRQFSWSDSMLYNPLVQIFLLILGATNIWFVFDYLHTTNILKKEKYRRDYQERQIRFALVCHIFDPNESGETIFLSKFQDARKWFYDKFSITKSYRDEIAICMTTLDGCFKDDINFSERLNEFVVGHPIENVYYTGIPFSNEQFPYMQCSKLFSPNRKQGMTIMYVCETSLDFFEDELESRMKSCLYNQAKTAFGLTKIFETGEMKNNLSVKLEFHKLDII